MSKNPLRARLDTVVRALVETAIADELGRDDLDGVPFVAETAEVMTRRLLGMQRYLGGGLMMMSLAFDAGTRATDGAAFHALPLARRRRALARVRGLQFGVANSFADFYGKLGGFTFWSHLEENHALDAVLGKGS
ncbi:MAG: hypothetical protein FJ090_05905 [Deltaproteobacteria bacterium]|nr:hypothetical protein [Deltaproteobacteria bacterium]